MLTKNDFRNLKVGAWLEDEDGIVEVVSTDNLSYNNCVSTAEVILGDDDTHSLGTVNPNTTYSDLRRCTIIA